MFGFGGNEEKPFSEYGTRSKLNSSHLFGWQVGLQKDLRKTDQINALLSKPNSWGINKNAPQLFPKNNYHSAIQNALFEKPEGFLGKSTVGVANRINDYLSRKGRGFIQGGFKTVGEVVAAAPLKSLSVGYGMGLGMMGVVEFGLMGKPISMSNMFQLATDNIAFTLGSELAGTGMKGMAKYMGWQMLGSELGLGTWGSLGLQVAGSLAVPGLGWGLGAGMLAYKGGKALYQGMKSIHDLGAASRQPEFTTKDMSWNTQNALTMRERSLGAIQNSHLNLRSVLGNEARMLMMAR